VEDGDSMIRKILGGIITIFFMAALASPIFAANYPKYFNRELNDYAGIINEEDKNEIVNAVKELKNKSGVIVTVLTIEAVEKYEPGKNPDDFAKEIFDEWNMGKKGILVIFSFQDKELKILTGTAYGNRMEKNIAAIQEGIIKPYFQKELYSKGIKAGTLELISLVSQRGIIVLGYWFEKEKFILSAVIGAIIIFFILAALSFMIQKEKGWGFIVFRVIFGLLGILISLIMFGMVNGDHSNRHRYYNREEDFFNMYDKDTFSLTYGGFWSWFGFRPPEIKRDELKRGGGSKGSWK